MSVDMLVSIWSILLVSLGKHQDRRVVRLVVCRRSRRTLGHLVPLSRSTLSRSSSYTNWRRSLVKISNTSLITINIMSSSLPSNNNYNNNNNKINNKSRRKNKKPFTSECFRPRLILWCLLESVAMLLVDIQSVSSVWLFY